MDNIVQSAAGGSGVRAAVEKYVAGVLKSDVDILREAFRPDAQMWGFLAGSPLVISVEQFYEVVASNPPPGALPVDLTPIGEWEDSYSTTIRGVEVDGDVGRAVLEEQGYRGANFVNYFSLLCEGGEWRIASKIFTTT